MIDRSRQVPASGISHVDALPPGTRLAEFEILSLLGVGGFGMVYKAFDHSLHRAVAIKEYMPSALAARAQGQSLWVRSSSDQQTFLTGLASFVEEARLLAQFDHPSLVKVFRFWESNNTAYMVMPLYSGMTFKQARAQMRTPPPEVWLRKMLWSVLSALRVLHDGNTLHRDISPDNIFLQDVGPPVLLDLGAARHAINHHGNQHTAVLKVNYAPIEQYADGDEELRQGPWSDLYSLGAVIHGCLCNDNPLPATLRSLRDRMVPFPRVAKTVKRQLGVTYSAPFVAAVTHALALKPEDRPQSIDAFLAAMEMTSPPEGVQGFDFRAELGDIWVEPADQPGPGTTSPTVDVGPAAKRVAEMGDALPTLVVHRKESSPAELGSIAASDARDGPDTVMMEVADTVVMDPARLPGREASEAAGSPLSMRSESASLEQPSPLKEARRHQRAPGSEGGTVQHARKYSPLLWLAAISCIVVLAASWMRWSQGDFTAQDDIITEWSESASPPDLVRVPTDIHSAEGGSQAVQALDRPAHDAAVLVAVAGEVSGFAASAPVSAPAQVTPKPLVTRALPRRTASEATQAPVVQDLPVAPSPEPPAPPKPRPAAVVARVATPQEVCADVNFLARPLCIHQECQKPSQSAQSVCVENKLRFEADEQRRRQTPN